MEFVFVQRAYKMQTIFSIRKMVKNKKMGVKTMAKYIDREKLLEELKESAKYHADTSREDVLLY